MKTRTIVFASTVSTGVFTWLILTLFPPMGGRAAPLAYEIAPAAVLVDTPTFQPVIEKGQAIEERRAIKRASNFKELDKIDKKANRVLSESERMKREAFQKQQQLAAQPKSDSTDNEPEDIASTPEKKHGGLWNLLHGRKNNKCD